MVLTVVAIVLVVGTVLEVPAISFVFKTVLMSPLKVKAEVKVYAHLQDSGRNLTTVLMMKKSELPYGEIISFQRAENIDDVYPEMDADVIATLENIEMNLTLLDENREVIWEHGETFKDSPSMDCPLPGLKIGRLRAQ